MWLTIVSVLVKLLHSTAVKTLVIDAVKLLAGREDNNIDGDVVKLVEDALAKF